MRSTSQTESSLIQTLFFIPSTLFIKFPREINPPFVTASLAFRPCAKPVERLAERGYSGAARRVIAGKESSCFSEVKGWALRNT
jgi:hypothetical protein